MLALETLKNTLFDSENANSLYRHAGLRPAQPSCAPRRWQDKNSNSSTVLRPAQMKAPVPAPVSCCLQSPHQGTSCNNIIFKAISNSTQKFLTNNVLSL
jgi:hypothetical protein